MGTKDISNSTNNNDIPQQSSSTKEQIKSLKSFVFEATNKGPKNIILTTTENGQYTGTPKINTNDSVTTIRNAANNTILISSYATYSGTLRTFKATNCHNSSEISKTVNSEKINVKGTPVTGSSHPLWFIM